MDDLLQEFVAEAREMLEASQSELVAWEQAPQNRAHLDAIFRFVHTIKGNCGFFDFPRLEALSHAAETALGEVRAGRRAPDSRFVSAILSIIDRIGAMVDAIENGRDMPEGDDSSLIAALEPRADDIMLEPSEPSGKDEQTSGGATETGASGSRTIRLPVELLDALMSGVSDLVLARNDLARRLRDAEEDPAVNGAFERVSTILGDVREGVTRLRMQRIQHLFNALPRLVRDLSHELGKQVMLDLDGGETELDREMIETVRDPLTHIIRNSMDHGFEEPQARREAGKREIGLLTVAASQSGNKIIVTVKDDGRGLDTARIVEKAIENGTIDSDEAASMSDMAKQDLIFAPGLSTAKAVSSVSGRGVGMDVVRTNLQRVGGSIVVDSKPGKGTTFRLEVPLTLSIIAGMTVEVDGQRFAIPRAHIEEIVGAKAASVNFSSVGDADLVEIRGERVPTVALASVLGIDPEARSKGNPLVMVRTANRERVAIAVDRVIDHEDLVVKPLAPAIMACRFYAGCTLLDDGSPVLLIDVPCIAEMAGAKLGTDAHAAIADEGEAQAKVAAPQRNVLVFETLAGRRAAIRMEMIARVEAIPRDAFDFDGRQLRVILDDTIHPVVGASGEDLPEETVRLLRLTDGSSELMYAIGKVVDTGGLPNDFRAGEGDEVCLVDGKLTQVVDGYALFAAHRVEREDATDTAGPTCRIDGSDGWSDTILKPLIEQLGYVVVNTDSDTETDIAVVLRDEPGGSGETPPARRVIRISSRRDGGGDAIYRYDRERLIDALAGASRGAA